MSTESKGKANKPLIVQNAPVSTKGKGVHEFHNNAFKIPKGLCFRTLPPQIVWMCFQLKCLRVTGLKFTRRTKLPNFSLNKKMKTKVQKLSGLPKYKEEKTITDCLVCCFYRPSWAEEAALI